MGNESQSWVNRFYEKLTAPKTIIFCGYGVMAAYFGLLIIAIIIAATLGPRGFSFTEVWISNLANVDTSPAPYLYDIACVAAGTLSIPFIFYQEKHIAPIPSSTGGQPAAPHRWAYRLMGLGFFFTLMSNFCYPGVGIFSEVRHYEEIVGINLHGLFTELTFGSYMLAAFFLGLLLIVIRQPIVPRPWNYIIGPIGMLAPSGMIILSMIEGNALREWGTLWAILAFVVPLFLFTLKHAGKQLHNKNKT